MFRRCSQCFDRLAREDVVHALEHFTVRFALLAFLLHLLAIGLNRWVPGLPVLPKLVGQNFFEAIHTPFGFILFYEVCLLVLMVPRSLTLSMGKQYEILSLIYIRGVFKDMSRLEHTKLGFSDLEALQPILFDMTGGLVMFGLVALYYRLSGARNLPEQVYPSLARFIELKKTLALLLIVTLLGLAFTNLWGAWAHHLAIPETSSEYGHLPHTDFYTHFFSMMVFADIFLLVVSFLYSDDYELIFRNAGFVTSTVLIRFSFVAEKPLDLAFALVAIIFGLCVLAIYQHFRKKLPLTEDVTSTSK